MLNSADILQVFDHLPAPALVLFADAPHFTIAASNRSYRNFNFDASSGVPGNHFTETALSSFEESTALHKVLLHKSPVIVEAKGIKFPDGELRHFDTTYTPLFSSEDNVKFIVCSFHEVTATVNSRKNEQKVSRNLQENAQLLTHVQEMANFGNWRWDIIENKVTWSATLYNIYGLNKDEFKATFEGYQELLHPDDRQIAYNNITQAMQTGKDVVFEERIIRPNGQIRFLRSWGRVQRNEDSQPVRMIGACLDITESKLSQQQLQEHVDAVEKQNSQLQEIAWMQSHVVRAPLVRIMGLVELMKQYSAEEINLPDTFNKIMDAAVELDDIIKDISARTEQLVQTGVATK